MVDGQMEFIRFPIIMDYRAPADTTTSMEPSSLFVAEFDVITAQIIDVTGDGSRKVIALTLSARKIV